MTEEKQGLGKINVDRLTVLRTIRGLGGDKIPGGVTVNSAIEEEEKTKLEGPKESDAKSK